MFVEFKKLSFSNIMSYGAAGAEIEFQPGFNTIMAVNGAGKSTILDALTFALFGKPYRDIKMGELVNVQNGKGLEVTVDFKIGKDLYTITRGLKPAKFEFLKNGQELDLLSSKKLNQDEIDKLLGINFRLFKNIVAMGVTNNKPFLSLSIGEKRTLIENIFNIDVLGLMCKDVKKRKSLKASEQALKTTELNGITRQIVDNQAHVKKLNEYINSFNEIKTANLQRINNSIKACQDRIKKADSNIKLAEKKIVELTDKLPECPDANEMSTIDRQIGMAYSTMERISSTLEKLSKKPTCPVCGSPLDEGHAKKHLDQMKEEYDENEKKIIPALQEKFNTYRVAIEEYRKAQEFIQTIKTKIRGEEVAKNSAQSELDKELDNLDAENNKTCPADTSDAENRIAELESASEALKKDIDDLENEIKVDTELVNILGDDGIKTYFFRKLTGILNKTVNAYLKDFELKNTELMFNEQMEESFTVELLPRSYEGFSAGERTRIDMAILLSFFDISRIISNWSCNMCMIDELLDQNIDAAGITGFISTLKNMIAKNKKKKLGFYIISHKLNEMNVDVASKIEIKKEHGYSNLKVIYG